MRIRLNDGAEYEGTAVEVLEQMKSAFKAAGLAEEIA